MSQSAASPQHQSSFRMKPGTVLGLALLLVVVIGLAIYFRPARILVPSVDRHEAQLFEAVAADTVFDLTVDDVTAISFARPADDVAFSLELRDGQWFITEPFTDRASDAAVAALLGYSAGIAVDELLEDAAANAAYGLDTPRLTASFTTVDGQTLNMVVAQPEDAVEWYIQASDKATPYLVRNLPDRPFSILAYEMIDGHVLDFNPADVVRLTTIIDDEVRVIEAENGIWYSDSDIGRGLVFDVNIFLRDLHDLAASSIAATADENRWADLGLAPAGETMHVELELADGTVQSLDIGRTTSDNRRYYVRSSERPHAYIVVEFSAVNLNSKLAQATTDVLSVNTERVTNIAATTVNKEGATVTREFVRDKDNKLQWASERRVAFYVASLLETINGVPAMQVAPEASAATYGFSPDPDSLRLTLTMENKAKHTLDIGNVTPDGQHVYVKTSMRPSVYLAPIAATRAIQTGLGVIRTDLLPFDTAAVSGVDLIQVASGAGSEPVVHNLVRSGDNWTVNGEAGNAANVQALVTKLRSMQAESIPPIIDEDAYQFYPAPGSKRITLHFNNGADSLTFDVGTTHADGVGWFQTISYYIRVSDLEEVVFIGDRTWKDLEKLIVAARS